MKNPKRDGFLNSPIFLINTNIEIKAEAERYSAFLPIVHSVGQLNFKNFKKVFKTYKWLKINVFSFSREQVKACYRVDIQPAKALPVVKQCPSESMDVVKFKKILICTVIVIPQGAKLPDIAPAVGGRLQKERLNAVKVFEINKRHIALAHKSPVLYI